MDEKLRNTIITFLQDAYNEGNADCGCVTDTSGQIEQVFRKAKWIEPQQPEGELDLLPVNFMLTLRVTEEEFRAHCKKCTHSCDVYPELCKQELQIAKVWHKAQLAHDKARMLPSEDELALWLCDHLNCTSRELAQELLLRLPKE